MISYYIFGIIAVATVYYILKLKRQHKKALDKVDCWKDELIKRKEEQIKEQNTIIKMQENILFHISDGIHNFGGGYFMEKNENFDTEYYKNWMSSNTRTIETKYFNKLNMFFSYSRLLARNISKNLYSKEEYEEILKFIQQDFHDYFHKGAIDLDLEKYSKLIHSSY